MNPEPRPNFLTSINPNLQHSLDHLKKQLHELYSLQNCTTDDSHISKIKESISKCEHDKEIIEAFITLGYSYYFAGINELRNTYKPTNFQARTCAVCGKKRRKQKTHYKNKCRGCGRRITN